MNFVQHATGLHAAGKQRSETALPAGALYQCADFKIESIVYFLGHGFHFIILQSLCSNKVLAATAHERQKNGFNTIKSSQPTSDNLTLLNPDGSMKMN